MLKKIFTVLTSCAIILAGNVAVTYVSAAETNDLPNTAPTLSVGIVEVSPKELEENNYIVKVPVTVKGTSYIELGFGVGYNTEEVLLQKCISGSSIQEAMYDGYTAICVPAINNELGITWSGITSILATGEEHIKEGDCVYLKFQVNKDAKPGDVYTLKNLADNAEYQRPDREVIEQIITPFGQESTTCNLENGAIVIVHNPIDEEVMMRGDVNMDDSISMMDVLYANKYYVGAVNLNSNGIFNADCYKDGVVDSKDTDTMIKFMSGEIESLPVIPEAAA